MATADEIWTEAFFSGEIVPEHRPSGMPPQGDKDERNVQTKRYHQAIDTLTQILTNRFTAPFHSCSLMSKERFREMHQSMMDHFLNEFPGWVWHASQVSKDESWKRMMSALEDVSLLYPAGLQVDADTMCPTLEHPLMKRNTIENGGARTINLQTLQDRFNSVTNGILTSHVSLFVYELTATKAEMSMELEVAVVKELWDTSTSNPVSFERSEANDIIREFQKASIEHQDNAHERFFLEWDEPCCPGIKSIWGE